MEKTTMVLRIKGLSEDQIQEYFGDFFASLVKIHPDTFRVGASVLKKGSEKERKVLKIADLS